MSDYLELDDIKIAQSLVHDLNVSTKMAALILNERDKKPSSDDECLLKKTLTKLSTNVFLYKYSLDLKSFTMFMALIRCNWSVYIT